MYTAFYTLICYVLPEYSYATYRYSQGDIRVKYFMADFSLLDYLLHIMLWDIKLQVCRMTCQVYRNINLSTGSTYLHKNYQHTQKHARCSTLTQSKVHSVKTYIRVIYIPREVATTLYTFVVIYRKLRHLPSRNMFVVLCLSLTSGAYIYRKGCRLKPQPPFL